MVIWITGLPASGKTTLGRRLLQAFDERGMPSHLLDGDQLRSESEKALTFSKSDRSEASRIASHRALALALEGSIAVVAMVSPYSADRREARSLMEAANISFIKVFLNTPLAICELRDPKGIYRQARTGLITNMTGIDDPYEKPINPEITIEANESIHASATLVLDLIAKMQSGEDPRMIQVGNQSARGLERTPSEASPDDEN